MTQRTNAGWLTALRHGGRVQDAALADLRAQLLGAIRAYLSRNAGQEFPAEEARHLAEDCAQDAILMIQANLDGFRGDSRFTTWAYAIAVRATLAELRRRRWRRAAVEKARLGQALPAWPIEDPGPERSLQRQQAWALLAKVIEAELTPLQRTAIVAHAFQGMPLDLVAEWLGSTRNSLYKLIHDARKKLKKALLAQGVSHEDLLALFGEEGSPSRFSPSGKNSPARII